MDEVFNAVGSFGGLVVLAGLFVWSYLKTQTRTDEMLGRIDESNKNIAASINAINNTTEVLKEYIIKHDERAKRIDDNIEYLKEKVR